MLCPHFSAFMCVVVHPFHRFVVSNKNLDLDSEYVNVGPHQWEVYQQEFPTAHLNLWKEESPTLT